MTDWKEVQGSQAERPSEFDATSSAVYVYQRKNIERVTIEGSDGSTFEVWQYEERKLTPFEYAQMSIEQTRADIDFISATTDIEL